MQNGMVEIFTAFMATIFVLNFNFYAAATFYPLDGNGKKKNKKKLRKAGQEDVEKPFPGKKMEKPTLTQNGLWKRCKAPEILTPT